MNVISCDAAYSLYPKATFEHRLSLVTRARQNDTENTDEALCKYETRGWDFIYHVDTEKEHHSPSFYYLVPRYIGDARCWTIPLDPNGITARIYLPLGSRRFDCDPVIGSGWSLAYGVYESDKYAQYYPEDHLTEGDEDDDFDLDMRGFMCYKTVSAAYLKCTYLANTNSNSLAFLTHRATRTMLERWCVVSLLVLISRRLTPIVGSIWITFQYGAEGSDIVILTC